jgi:D-alanine transaminase
MARTVYVNGSYCPYDLACIHVEDRGYQFADAVYEVCEVRGGALVDERLHLDRLWRSLTELRITPPMSRLSLGVVLRETVRRNRVRQGHVYLQVSRGVAKRDFAFPAPGVAASVVCYARAKAPSAIAKRAANGIRVITMHDTRWRRPDIKSVSLLPNALARQAAHEAGAQEAWLVDENGLITEGAASNAWIVAENGTLVTRPADMAILRGITRTVLLRALSHESIALVERPFSIEEAKSAQEAFVTSATSTVMPVVAVDGVPVGDGRPGPVTRKLRELFGAWAEISDVCDLRRPKHGASGKSGVDELLG